MLSPKQVSRIFEKYLTTSQINVRLTYGLGSISGTWRRVRLGRSAFFMMKAKLLTPLRMKAIDLDITGSGGGSGGGSGNNEGEGSGVVFIDPSIYEDDNPTAFCQPPCTFVFPPWQLPYTTTISPTPATSTVLNQWTDVVTRQNPGGVTSAETLTFSTTMGNI